MTPQEALEILKTFNEWRRGNGAYGFTDDPEDYKSLPYTPKEIGEAIDVACTILDKVANLK